MDTKKIYNLVASTADEKRSWITSIEKEINVWLELEKHKDNELKNEIVANSPPKVSRSLAEITRPSKLKGLDRAETCASSMPVWIPSSGTSGSRSSIESSNDGNPIKNIQKDAGSDILLRLQELETSFKLMSAKNDSLQKQIIELQSVVAKQGKELKKLKKKGL